MYDLILSRNARLKTIDIILQNFIHSVPTFTCICMNDKCGYMALELDLDFQLVRAKLVGGILAR